MHIAKIENGEVAQVAHYKIMFPDTSFPPSGPNDDFIAANGCLHVSMFKPHDRATQTLVACAPHIIEGVVYTVEVADRDPAEIAAETLMQAKAQRQAEVDALIVTTQSGKAFDGHEDAQNRMARAITASAPGEQTLWVLADNMPTLVSREELQEALRLAGTAQTEIWVRPYL